ncbi:MAG TPA: choice-of-anchor D domain-containing protein [Steroidobacteraceae bacterium]|nr:choice-of-anchor D domain-containing protein [Steroidobacteraceae bacterium]
MPHARAVRGTVALALLAWGLPAHAQTCAQPLGVLDALLVADVRVAALDPGVFIVERGGQPVDMSIGEPLCEADRMATRPDATAKLLVGPAEGPRHELTVLPGATVVLQSVSRVELVIGRLLAAVQGDFDVVMPFARLAATGTEFAVEVTQEGCRVDQLEGSTGLTPSAGATARLERLKTASCTATAAAATDLAAGRCTELMTAASSVDIAARPRLASGNVIRQLDPAEAPAVYARAREAAICDNNAAAWQAVDRVLVDWERPRKTLDAEDPLVRGRALLMRGEPQQARDQFCRALAVGGAAAVRTGFGDAERDLGLNALNTNDMAGAGAHFESALQHYAAAIQHATSDQERGVILVNLGHLALLRTKLDADATETRLGEAQAYFEQARAHGDPPHARVGLARVALMRAQLIPTQQLDSAAGGAWDVFRANLLLVILAEQQRRPHRREARRLLRSLVADLPDFAPAQQLLGEVQYLLGERDDAQASLRRAIAADPGNTEAYLAYAQTLRGARKQMYEATYRLAEVAAVRELAATQREVLVPEVKSTTIPPAPLTADPPSLGFELKPMVRAAQAIRRTVTMTNRSESAATVSGTNVTGNHPGAFAVVANGCTPSPIAPGASCTITVAFVAREPGRYRAALEISFAGGVLSREIRLYGEVSAPPPPPPPVD